MNPESQRIAIAEACGWKNIHEDVEHYRATGDHESSSLLCGRRSDGIYWRVPDYYHDLNAMHEAENDLSPVLRSIYCDFLMYGRANPDPRPEVFGRWQTVNATAAQRAESFLRTIGKWEENQ